jgi:hypothetical protein
MKGSAGYLPWMLSKENLRGRFFDPKTWRFSFNVVKQKLQKNNDHFIITCGLEGAGKSTLSLQIAAAIDPNFSLKNIAYSSLDFYRLVENLSRGSVIVIDEAHRLLAADMSTTRAQHDLILLLQEMRQAGLCVIMNLPYFRGLSKYLREHRIDSLFLVLSRGKMKYLNKQAIGIVNEVTTKVKNMQPNSVTLPSGTFYHGSFSKVLPSCIDEQEYVKLKDSNFYDFVRSKREDLEKEEKQKTNKDFVDVNGAMQIIPASARQLYRMASDGTIESMNVGRKVCFSIKSLKKYVKSQGNQAFEADQAANYNLLPGKKPGGRSETQWKKKKDM